jgi:mannosyl-3-phosphoglycerate phosphatase
MKNLKIEKLNGTYQKNNNLSRKDAIINNEKLVFYSDIDGTLIDHETYSYNEAKQALNEINKNNIPLVLVSSKTRAEVEALRDQFKKDNLQLRHPFIYENGSAISIPKKYFNFDIKKYTNYKIEEKNDDLIIEISQVKYNDLVNILKDIEKEINAKIIGFDDLTPEELSKQCGLKVDQAILAKKREFDEPFRIEPEDPELYKQVEEIIKSKGLNYTKGGRYTHIMGRQDKGLAVKILDDLYKRQYSGIKTVGIGDSRNDLEFLEFCDRGYLVNNPKKPLDASVESQKVHLTNEIGPKGFNEVVIKAISD